MALTVPDNIPADALDIIQDFINDLSKQDSAGGLKSFGYYVEQEDGFHVGSIGPQLQLMAIGNALTRAKAVRALMGHEQCSCASCRAERGAEPDQEPEAKTNDLFDRVFGRGRK